MKLVALALGRCGVALSLALPLALLATIYGLRTAQNAPAAAGWFHLPLFVGTLAATTAAIETWPLFARDRPGALWLQRLRPGPLYGCGAIAIGALVALIPCCLLVGGLTAWLLPGLPSPREHFALRCMAAHPLLDGPALSLTFSGPGDVQIDELQLRPRAFAPEEAPQAVTLAAIADGQSLATEPITIANTGQLRGLRFQPRRIGVLELRRTGGNLPLVFLPGSVIAIASVPRSTAVNLSVAALLYLLPAFVMLAVACLGALWLSLPVNLAGLLGMLFVLTLGDLTPAGLAVNAALRGHWLPSEDLFPACVPSLLAGLVAMIVAMFLRARGNS